MHFQNLNSGSRMARINNRETRTTASQSTTTPSILKPTLQTKQTSSYKRTLSNSNFQKARFKNKKN
jgi:hypothetical protein